VQISQGTSLLKGLERGATRIFRAAARAEGAWHGWLFPIWTAFWVLNAARSFLGYMLKQTEGEWSAPLDDVFIHFDYARATALGAPFEWVPGNGVSSGNTSLTYPFALALGYRLGFTDESLMQFAAVLAMTCVFVALLVGKRAYLTSFVRGRDSRVDATFSRWLVYLWPPLALGLGALNWSLWSGMEVAWFLATWAVAFAMFLPMARAPSGPTAARRERVKPEWWLGMSCGLMVITRPEALGTALAFALFLAARRRGLGTMVRVLAPSVLLVVAQMLFNQAMTGDRAQSGAIIKVTFQNPFLTGDEKLEDYLRNLRHAVFKNLEYHFADAPPFGVWLLLLGGASFFSRKSRAIAGVLLLQIVLWFGIVALNNQVLWQNERYVMPAIFWLLLMAQLGVGALAQRTRPGLIIFALLAGAALVARRLTLFASTEHPTLPYGLGVDLGWVFAGLFVVALALQWRIPRVLLLAIALYTLHTHQEPRWREQRWFFGRAARNIRDQQTTLGRHLRNLPDVRRGGRIAVGDAGAIIYASNAKGLDLIGLGGYHDYPFARANVAGLGATVELIERMPARERPVYLALFPSWWGNIPLWFSSGELARFPAEGNVICGDYEHVLYRADWHLLGTGEQLSSLPAGTTQVRDTLDVGDIVDERNHAYRPEGEPASGRATMKILPAPGAPHAEMFDGGREILSGQRETYRLRHLVPGRAVHLVIRTAPEEKTRIAIYKGSQLLGEVDLRRPHPARFVEVPVVLHAEHVTEEMSLEVRNIGLGRFTDYHVFAAQ
jgi:hypothetical protein